MRRGSLLAVVLVLAVVAAGIASAATAAPVRIAPGSGGPRTVFRVRFTAPAASGPQTTGASTGTQSASYTVSATGPAHPRPGCLDALVLRPVASRAGQAMSVALSSRGARSGWCAGRYHGYVQEQTGPRCGPIVASSMHPAAVCPEYASRTVQLGTFAFHVR